MLALWRRNAKQRLVPTPFEGWLLIILMYWYYQSGYHSDPTSDLWFSSLKRWLLHQFDLLTVLALSKSWSVFQNGPLKISKYTNIRSQTYVLWIGLWWELVPNIKLLRSSIIPHPPSKLSRLQQVVPSQHQGTLPGKPKSCKGSWSGTENCPGQTQTCHKVGDFQALAD